MKLYMEPITVTLRDEIPRCIEWRGSPYMVVSMIDEWVASGEWWGRAYQRYYLLLETDRGILEVFRSDPRNTGASEWHLSRMYD